MKKTIMILSILILTFLLTACSEEMNEEPNNREKVENIQENKTDTVDTYYEVEEMNTYSIFQFIRLKENPTTGYSWQYKVADETVAVVEDDEYVQMQVEEGIVGAGGVHTYRLSGISVGETTITFKYMRPWEGEESAVKTVTFKLVVNDNKEISVTKVEENK